MSLIDILLGVEIPEGVEFLFTFSGLQHIFELEKQYATPEARDQARAQRHQRRENRERAEAAAEQALATNTEEEPATGAEPEEVVDVDVPAETTQVGEAGGATGGAASVACVTAAQPVRRKQTATKGGRSRRCKDGQKKKAPQTTAKRKPEGATAKRKGPSKTKGTSSVTKKPTRKPATSKALAIEPLAKYPFLIEFGDNVPEDAQAKLRSLADKTMESIFALYDASRQNAVLLCLACMSRLLLNRVWKLTGRERQFARKQREALEVRLAEPAARSAVAAALQLQNQQRAQEVRRRAKKRERAQALKKKEEKEEEECTDGQKTDAPQREKSRDAPSPPRSPSSCSSDSTVASELLEKEEIDMEREGLSEDEDKVALLMFQINRLATFAFDEVIPMHELVRMLGDHQSFVECVTVRPQRLLEVYEEQREAQLTVFETAWREAGNSVGLLVEMARRIQSPRTSRAKEREHDDDCAHGDGATVATTRGGHETEPATDEAVTQAMSELRCTPLPWDRTTFAKLLARNAAGPASREKAAGTTKKKARAGGVPQEKAERKKTGPQGEGRRGAPEAASPELFLSDVGTSIFDRAMSFCLITPHAPPIEVARVLHWMLADTTEVELSPRGDADSTDSDGHSSGEVKGSGSVASALKLSGEVADDAIAQDEVLWDPKAGVLSFVHEDRGTILLRLRNPLPAEVGDVNVNFYSCDACNNPKITVGFDAVRSEGVDDKRHFSSQDRETEGYNVCLPCAFLMYKRAMLRLARALHPDGSVRERFAHGPGCGLRVEALRVGAAPLSHEGLGGGWEVRVRVAVAPCTARPMAWVVPTAALQAMGQAFPTLSPGEPLTEAQRRALPVPAAPYTAFQSPSVVPATFPLLLRKDSGEEEPPETCSVCLEPLRSVGPAVRTRCGHWFHVACLESYRDDARGSGEVDLVDEAAEETQTAGNGRGCPLCRRAGFMPALTERVALEQHVYSLALSLPEGESGSYVDADTGAVAIAVAALLSPDGVYHNPTNVAACELFFVKPLTAPRTRGPCSATGALAATTPPVRPPKRKSHMVQRASADSNTKA